MMNITQALAVTLEKAESMTLSELAVLHKILVESPQKKASRKADLIGGVINSKKKALKESGAVQEVTEDEGKVLVENSTKAPVKPKHFIKPKQASKPSKTVKQEEKEELEQLGAESIPPVENKPQDKPKIVVKPKADVKPVEKAEDKQEDKKEEDKKPSFKQSISKPDLSKMSQAELLAYIQTLEAESEIFPSEIEGKSTVYKRHSFNEVNEIQERLLKFPYSTFMFIDEKFEDEKLTQFLVLFANHEVVVLLDRTRKKNSTMTIPVKDFDGKHVTQNKVKYEYSFYIREKK